MPFQLGKHLSHTPPDEIARAHHVNISVVHILIEVVRAGEHGDEARHLLQERQLAVAFGVHCGQRLMLLGNVLALEEDARYFAALVDDRLVSESKKERVEFGAGRTLQAERDIARHVRLACREGAVERLEQASSLKFRKHRAHGLAEKASLASDAIIGVIHILEDVFRSAQNSHETGYVLEQ